MFISRENILMDYTIYFANDNKSFKNKLPFFKFIDWNEL